MWDRGTTAKTPQNGAQQGQVQPQLYKKGYSSLLNLSAWVQSYQASALSTGVTATRTAGTPAFATFFPFYSSPLLPTGQENQPRGQPAAKATAPMVIPPRGAVFSIFAVRLLILKARRALQTP